jgi:Na+/H+-dicarboxylate symporter
MLRLARPFAVSSSVNLISIDDQAVADAAHVSAAPPAAQPPPAPPGTGEPGSPGGWLARWQAIPLYLRILGGVVLGIVAGLALGDKAQPLIIPSRVILQLLTALAGPLVLLAVVHALMNTQLPKGSAVRLLSLLLLNTVVAILIGLAVANVVQPGRWTKLKPPAPPAEKKQQRDLLPQILDNVPRSLLGPLSDGGKVTSVVIIAVAFGIALRRMKDVKVAAELVGVGFRLLITVLHWIIELIPLAVFGIVASIVGTEGFASFVGLGVFMFAVILALLLQLTYYLTRIWLGSWVKPWKVIRDMRDALVMAFSTASSTITMPVTYACLREKVGLREQSASLGALIGANFNNDGTALYQAMAALFIAQSLDRNLSIEQQVLVVLTAIIASVGATGIPEAGIVTLTLIFSAVDLPTEYIPILLTVDWFLDRCRTMVNVMGDVNVSCLLDGKQREPHHPPDAEESALAELA